MNEGFGYILAWLIYFDHLQDATFSLKSGYVSQLKQEEIMWSAFMEFIFGTLGLGSQVRAFDLSKWDVQDMDVTGNVFLLLPL